MCLNGYSLNARTAYVYASRLSFPRCLGALYLVAVRGCYGHYRRDAGPYHWPANTLRYHMYAHSLFRVDLYGM